MGVPDMTETAGRVASLHLHPAQPGDPMQAVASFEVIADKGIRNDPRYFDRRQPATGKPSHRQVSLIEREQIAEHAAVLGLQTIPPGAVRANIETVGLRLVPWVGQWIRVGEAILRIHAARTPCARMDAVCRGLRERMESGRQGVLAQVVQSGVIRVGDPIRLVREPILGAPPVSTP